ADPSRPHGDECGQHEEVERPDPDTLSVALSVRYRGRLSLVLCLRRVLGCVRLCLGVSGRLSGNLTAYSIQVFADLATRSGRRRPLQDSHDVFRLNRIRVTV